MRWSILWTVVIACNGPLRPGQEPARPVASKTAPQPDAPTTVERVRLDRAPVDVDGPPTWSSGYRVDVLRFCPGDAALIALDTGGNLRRFRTTDGAQLASTHLGRADYPAYPLYPPIECRADGVALALDVTSSPVLVDSRGTVTRPPEPIPAKAARFAADGSVAALAMDGTVTRWAGSAVTVALRGEAHAMASALVQGGVRLKYEDHVTPAGVEGSAWLIALDGKRTRIRGKVDEFARAEIAPDGGLVATDNVAAWGWNVQRGVRAGAAMLLETNQAMITSIAASNRWFAATGAFETLTVMDRRSGMHRDVKAPCGAGQSVYAVAITGDDARFALSCDSGVRIVDPATLKPVTQGP